MKEQREIMERITILSNEIDAMIRREELPDLIKMIQLKRTELIWVIS